MWIGIEEILETPILTHLRETFMCHTARSIGASQTQARHRSPMLLIGVVTTVFMLGAPKG